MSCNEKENAIEKRTQMTLDHDDQDKELTWHSLPRVTRSQMKRQCFDKLQFLKQFYNIYCKRILKQFLLAIDLHYQWEKLFSVCICCRVISVCHIESAFAGC